MSRNRTITNNTLFNEIIRIDFYKIKDIDNMAEKINELLSKEKYTFKTTDIRNVNINIDDPETLFTQELIKSNITSNINTTKNYEYISENENHKFILNEYFIIFEKNNFSSYGKMETYLETLKKIVDIIISEPEIKISRVGIRKMNQLFLGKIETIEKYFNIMIPKKDYKNIDEYAITQKNLDNEGSYSSNIMMNLKRGKGNINFNETQIEMFRFIWDIDCYKRNVESQKIIEEITNLNNHLFERYNDVLTDELYRILENKEINMDELIKLDIYGGINKNG